MQQESNRETIRRFLSEYQIGEKLRRLRLKKKLSLVDLGRRIGLSASMLSQIESGKILPTLPFLTRLGEVFGVGLAYFFTNNAARKLTITRIGDLIQFPNSNGSPLPSYCFKVLAFNATGKTLFPYLAEFPKRPFKEGDGHAHNGFELLYVIEGNLLIIHDREEYVLHAGDTAYFDASAPHSYHGLSEPSAKALVATSP